MADILHVEILLLNTSLKEAQTKWIVQNYPQRTLKQDSIFPGNCTTWNVDCKYTHTIPNYA